MPLPARWTCEVDRIKFHNRDLCSNVVKRAVRDTVTFTLYSSLCLFPVSFFFLPCNRKQGISILFSSNISYLFRTRKVWNLSSPLSLSSLVEQLVDSTVMCGSCRQWRSQNFLNEGANY